MGVLANIKCTMEFVYGTTGWSESHFYVGTALGYTQPVYTDFLALCQARAQCLDPVNATFALGKMSADNITRDVIYIKRADLPTNNGGAGYA
ncbi:MAG: hypothetical protein WBQ94_17770, partial [Terracidiphilus sp.]